MEIEMRDVNEGQQIAARNLLDHLAEMRSRLDGMERMVRELFEPNLILLRSVGELKLSLRAEQCLKAEGILCIGDLVQLTEHNLLRVPNLGRGCIKEIKGALTLRALGLGTKLDSRALAELKKLSAG